MSVAFKFLDTKNIRNNFDLYIDEDEEDDITLQDLIDRAKKKVKGFVFDGAYQQPQEELRMDRPASYYRELFTPFYFHINERAGDFDIDLECETDFADVENTSGLVHGKFADSAPDYRICCKGLNLLGNCTNSHCVAYNKEVVVKYGFKTYDTNSVDACDVKCPMCKEVVVAKTSLFTDCQYKFHGLKKGVAKPFKSPKWKKVEGDFEYFDPSKDKCGTCTWMKLTIFVKRIDSDTSDTCTRCNQIIGNGDKKIVDSSCGHPMHQACADKAGSQKCFICNVPK